MQLATVEEALLHAAVSTELLGRGRGHGPGGRVLYNISLKVLIAATLLPTILCVTERWQGGGGEGDTELLGAVDPPLLPPMQLGASASIIQHHLIFDFPFRKHTRDILVTVAFKVSNTTRGNRHLQPLPGTVLQ